MSRNSGRKILRIIFFTCLQIVAVGVVDALTSQALGFFVFYFIPIGYSGWFAGRSAGLFCSLLSIGTWLAINLLENHFYPSGLIGAWNALIRFLAFVLFALSTAKAGELLRLERQLNRRLQDTLNQVRELRGLLPICAACKKIRDDQGYWEQIETYISNHSRAEFTHGICPECARKLYPEFFPAREADSSPPPRTSEPGDGQS